MEDKNNDLEEYVQKIISGYGNISLDSAIKVNYLVKTIYGDIDKDLEIIKLYKKLIVEELKNKKIPEISEFIKKFNVEDIEELEQCAKCIYAISNAIIENELSRLIERYITTNDNNEKRKIFNEIIEFTDRAKDSRFKKYINADLIIAEELINSEAKSVKPMLRHYEKEEALDPKNVLEKMQKELLLPSINRYKNILTDVISVKRKKDDLENALNRQREEWQYGSDFAEEAFKKSDDFNIYIDEFGVTIQFGGNEKNIYVASSQCRKKSLNWVANKIEKMLDLPKGAIYDYGIDIVSELRPKEKIKSTKANEGFTAEMLAEIDPRVIKALYIINKNAKYKNQVKQLLKDYVTLSVEPVRCTSNYTLNTAVHKYAQEQSNNRRKEFVQAKRQKLDKLPKNIHYNLPSSDIRKNTTRSLGKQEEIKHYAVNAESIGMAETREEQPIMLAQRGIGIFGFLRVIKHNIELINNKIELDDKTSKKMLEKYNFVSEEEEEPYTVEDAKKELVAFKEELKSKITTKIENTKIRLKSSKEQLRRAIKYNLSEAAKNKIKNKGRRIQPGTTATLAIILAKAIDIGKNMGR